MKRNVLKRLLASALCALMVVGLSACGNNGVATSKDPVPASKAFGTKGIWYEGVPSDKSNSVKSILYFNGSGQVTWYQTSSDAISDYIKFADLNKKSNEEIIKLAKERDKTLFDKIKSEVLAAYQKNVDYLNEEKNKLQSEYNSKNYNLASDYVFYDKNDIPKWYEKHIRINKLGLDFYNLLIEKVNAIEYKEPKPLDFTLSAETDNTGNSISKEKIEFNGNYSYFSSTDISSFYNFSINTPNSFKDISSVDELIKNYNEEYKKKYNQEFSWDSIAYPKRSKYTSQISLKPDGGARNIYDMVFRGYETLTTMTDGNHAGFILDNIDAKGVEIDK